MTCGSRSVNVLFLGAVGAVAAALLVATFFASRAPRSGKTGESSAPVRNVIVVAAAMAAWLFAMQRTAKTGALLVPRAGPPVLARMVLVASFLTIAVALSPIGKRWIETIPLAAILGFQVFRIPVEIVLDSLYRQDLAPIQMTFEGLNFDIASGLSAIVVAILAARGSLPRWGLLTWNVFGLLLLVAIVVIANTSMPGRFRLFQSEPPSTIILMAPFIWLPTFLVPSALFGHVLVFRKWRALRAERARP